MNYDEFEFNNPDYIILTTRTRYTRTASGKSWKSKPDSVEYKVYTPLNYTRHIQSTSFFNTFGTCRVSKNYTIAGYLPVSETSVNPGRDTKIITNFIFVNRKRAYNSGGYRERAVLDNLETWKPFECNDRRVYTFVARDGSMATYEPGYNRWIG